MARSTSSSGLALPTTIRPWLVATRPFARDTASTEAGTSPRRTAVRSAAVKQCSSRARWPRRPSGLRRSRHDHLRAQMARHLPDWDVPPVRGGQTLWVRLPRGDGTSFAQAALRHRVAVLPGNGLDASGNSAEYLRLNFL